MKFDLIGRAEKTDWFLSVTHDDEMLSRKFGVCCTRCLSEFLCFLCSRTTAFPPLRPASSSYVCLRTPARPSWRSGCATPSTTAALSTWTTTCSPETLTTQRAQTRTTDAGRSTHAHTNQSRSPRANGCGLSSLHTHTHTQSHTHTHTDASSSLHQS